MVAEVADLIALTPQAVVPPPEGETLWSAEPASGYSVEFTFVTEESRTSWSKSEAKQATTEEFASLITDLTARITKLEKRVESLISAQGDYSIWITTLAPKPYSLLKNIPVLIEPVLADDKGADCSYVARFVEAGVGASGDTVEETVSYLKDRLISSFEALSRMPAEKLGDLPKRRLAVLRAVMRGPSHGTQEQQPGHKATRARHQEEAQGQKHQRQR